MDKFEKQNNDSVFGDVVSLLAEKNRIIKRQEKDIGSLKRELATIKDQLNCYLDEKK